MVRIPLQVGTGAFGYATGAAVGGPLAIVLAAISVRCALTDWIVSAILVGLLAALLVAYTVSALRMARRLRASDLVVSESGVAISGGPHGGRTFAWSELAAPFATTTSTKEARVELAWLLVAVPLSIIGGLVLSAIFGESTSEVSFVRSVTITRLRLRLTGGTELLVAATDDTEEAASLHAARDTVAAAAEGRRVVEQAPFHTVRIVACAQCGAAVVPSDAATVRCAHCGASVPMGDDARKLAASARDTAQARAESHRLVKSLLDQPEASRVDGTFRVLSFMQIAAWLVGWGVVGWHARTSGWPSIELRYVFAPIIGVLAVYFIALGAASERRALRALTLGFGALAPSRAGDTPQCRRCHGPLAAAAGVASCVYCGADNIAGIDLRAAVGAARSEQPTFEQVLRKRREKRVSGIGLKIVAAIFALFWLALTIGHAMK